MRSVVVHRQGGPEVLELVEGPAPEPGPGQVRVAVAAAGVNFRDLQQRSGGYPARTPFVMGAEGAGTVTAVGPEVDDLRVGNRVAWAMVDGAGYTEQAVVPAGRAVPVPDAIDDETAAAVLLQGLTAHYLTRSTYAVRTGDDVLVHAAAGGTGLLVVQLAKRAGARVIGTVSTPEKAALAREAGADDVLLSSSGTLVDDVRELTGGHGVHVVYDGVGGPTFEVSGRSLRRRGSLVLFGLAGGPVAPIDPSILGRGSLFLTRPGLADHVATREELLDRAEEVLGWVAGGELAVRIGGRYPLAEARRAHEDLASRRTTGKLLVLPGS
jgi:NADPH2:quinone reductase